MQAHVPFDLHALSTPPAFILDQDQILKKELLQTQKSRNVITALVAAQKSTHWDN